MFLKAKRYKKFHNYLFFHSNSLIKNLPSITTPGSPSPQGYLKVNGVEIYYIKKLNKKNTHIIKLQMI